MVSIENAIKAFNRSLSSIIRLEMFSAKLNHISQIKGSGNDAVELSTQTRDAIRVKRQPMEPKRDCFAIVVTDEPYDHRIRCLICNDPVDSLTAQYGRVIGGLQKDHLPMKDHVINFDWTYEVSEWVRSRQYLSSKSGFICDPCFRVVDGKTVEKDGEQHLIYTSLSIPKDRRFERRPQSLKGASLQAEAEARAVADKVRDIPEGSVIVFEDGSILHDDQWHKRGRR